MRKLLSIYRRLIEIRIRAQMAYRVPFLLDVVSAVIGSVTAFVALALVFQRFNGIGGWGLWDVALLYGMIETSYGIMEVFFSGFDGDEFSRLVRMGSFDQMLLRPIPAALQVFGSDVELRRIGRILQGLVVLGLALWQTWPHWTLLKLLYLPVVLAGQIAFFGGLYIFGGTLTFWTVERIEAVNIFTYGGTEMMAYPMTIYADWIKRFFTYILPGVFINYAPALFFLDKPDPMGLPPFAPFLAPLVGLGVLAACAWLWGVGVRNYQSTGS